MTVTHALDDQPADGSRGRGDHRVDEGERSGLRGAERRAGVEAEPAEEQQAGTEQHERQAVRLHRRLGPTDATTEHDGEREASSTGVDVDRRTTGEVEDAAAGEPPGAVPPSALPKSKTQCATGK